MKAVFYRYRNCDTCRKAARFLEKHGLAVEIREIVETPPSTVELRRMAGLVGGVRKLFNTSGQHYRELGLSEKLPTLSEADALALLAENGKLIKRPFLLWESGGLVGFSEEVWKKELRT